MKVKFLDYGWQEGTFISLTPIIINEEIRFYLIYLNKNKETDYFWTSNLINIKIIENEI